MSPVAYSYLVAKYQRSSGPYGPIFYFLICWITFPTDLKNWDFNKKKKRFGDPAVRNVTMMVAETL